MCVNSFHTFRILLDEHYFTIKEIEAQVKRIAQGNTIGKWQDWAPVGATVLQSQCSGLLPMLPVRVRIRTVYIILEEPVSCPLFSYTSLTLQAIVLFNTSPPCFFSESRNLAELNSVVGWKNVWGHWVLEDLILGNRLRRKIKPDLVLPPWPHYSLTFLAAWTWTCH